MNGIRYRRGDYYYYSSKCRAYFPMSLFHVRFMFDVYLMWGRKEGRIAREFDVSVD